MPITPYQAFHQHKDNLSTLIFPFLDTEERENLGLADQAWRKANVTFEEGFYHSLKHRVEWTHAVWMRTTTGEVHRERLTRVLGYGGRKKAIELSKGRALLVPNMDLRQSMVNISACWKRVVHEEVAMSKLLTKIGLLGPLSQRVSLSFTTCPNAVTIPAYLCDSFESLGKTKGCFIIDGKSWEASSWRLGEDFLFKTKED